MPLWLRVFKKAAKSDSDTSFVALSEKAKKITQKWLTGLESQSFFALVSTWIRGLLLGDIFP